MNEWLGENAADTLAKIRPQQYYFGNGAGAAGCRRRDSRPYPAVIDYLHHAKDDNFLDGLVQVEGGQAARDAIDGFLNQYGMRCAGEIDITRDRWCEQPTTLVPLILST